MPTWSIINCDNNNKRTRKALNQAPDTGTEQVSSCWFTVGRK